MGNEMNVTNVAPFNVDVKYQKLVQGSKWTGKGYIPESVTFNWKGENGDNKTSYVKNNDYDRINKLIPYMSAFNEFSTTENPNITPRELHKIKVNITKQTNAPELRTGYSCVYYSNDSTRRQDYFQLLDVYSDKASDGGEEITPKEQAAITDTFAKWYID